MFLFLNQAWNFHEEQWSKSLMFTDPKSKSLKRGIYNTGMDKTLGIT